MVVSGIRILELPADFQSLLEQEEYQEVREMRGTYFDKLKRQGMQEILTRQLQAKFGLLFQSVADKIRTIESEDELTELAKKVITAKSSTELGLDNT